MNYWWGVFRNWLFEFWGQKSKYSSFPCRFFIGFIKDFYFDFLRSKVSLKNYRKVLKWTQESAWRGPKRLLYINIFNLIEATSAYSSWKIKIVENSIFLHFIWRVSDTFPINKSKTIKLLNTKNWLFSTVIDCSFHSIYRFLILVFRKIKTYI